MIVWLNVHDILEELKMSFKNLIRKSANSLIVSSQPSNDDHSVVRNTGEVNNRKGQNQVEMLQLMFSRL